LIFEKQKKPKHMFWPSKEKDVKLNSSVLLPERPANEKIIYLAPSAPVWDSPESSYSA